MFQTKEDKFQETLAESKNDLELVRAEAERLRHEQVMGGERGLETEKLRAKVQAKRAEELERRLRYKSKAYLPLSPRGSRSRS